MIIKIIEANNDKNIHFGLCEKTQKNFEEDDEFVCTYTIDDCVLIRTTEHFPFNHEVLSGKSAHGVVKESLDIVSEYIWHKCPNLSEEEKINLINNLKIYNIIERNTVHWCINGLVGSHGFNDFSERPFIIIEPLKYHVNDKNLMSLRAEDTYFSDRVKLSDKAILLIKEETYNEIKDNPLYKDELETYNIYLYYGKYENEAVIKLINELGYDAFNISTYGYSDTSFDDDCERNSTEAMRQFLINYTNEHNLPAERHFNSPSHREENIKMKMFEIRTTRKIIETIIKELGLKELGFKESDWDYKFYDPEFKEYVYELLEKYGFEKLHKLIETINNETLSKVEQEKNSDLEDKQR